MKENTDPHQIVISREYFDKLIALARDNDHSARRRNHPNQTILSRILWHARKYNSTYKLEESQRRFVEQNQLDASKRSVSEFVKKHRGQVITFVFLGGLVSCRVIEISRKDKTRIHCKQLNPKNPRSIFIPPPVFMFYEIKRNQQ